MPYLDIADIIFVSPAEDDTLDTNFIGITIKYMIVPLGQSGNLDITV